MIQSLVFVFVLNGLFFSAFGADPVGESSAPQNPILQNLMGGDRALSREKCNRAIQENLLFLDNLFETGNQSGGSRAEAFAPFLSQLPDYLSTEVSRMLAGAHPAGEIQAYTHRRMRELQELAYEVRLLAQAHFESQGVFNKEKPTELDDLVLTAFSKEIPTAILEEVWEASRFRLIHQIQKWFLENRALTRKNIEESGISTFLSEAELKVFVFNSQVPALLDAFARHEYNAYWYVASSRRVPADREVIDAISFHVRMRSELKRKLMALNEEFPDLVDLEKLEADLLELRGKAESAFQDWYAAQTPAAVPAEKKIYQALLGAGEWFLYVTIGNLATYNQVVHGFFNGKGAMSGFEAGGRFINAVRSSLNQHGGGSVLGSDPEFVYGHRSVFYYRYFLGPVVQLGNAIQASLEIFEDGYVRSVMALYGFSREEYNELLKGDPWIRSGKAMFYVSEAAIGLAVVLSGAGSTLAAKGLTGGALWKAQAGLLVRPVAVSLGLGLVFSAGQEFYSAGLPDGQFSTQNLLKNTAVSAAGTLIFMGGISKVTQLMAIKGASEMRTMLVASGIDAIEGSADIPQTLIMAYDSNNRLQYLGTALVALGNIWDTGDAVFSVGSIAYQNGVSQLSAKLGEAQPLFPEDFSRVMFAVSLIGRPLAAQEVDCLLHLKSLHRHSSKQLRMAGFSEAEADEILKALVSLEDLKSK